MRHLGWFSNTVRVHKLENETFLEWFSTTTYLTTRVGGNENKIVCCSRNDQAILPSTSIFTLIFNICFSNSTSCSLCLKLLFAFVQSHESHDARVSLHVSGSFSWDTWNDNWCYQVLIQAYRPISLKAKHFGFWREEAQFSSCLEFLCSSPRLIKGQWCFCPTSQLTGNYVFTIICNVIYKLYEILKNVGKCVLGDL